MGEMDTPERDGRTRGAGRGSFPTGSWRWASQRQRFSGIGKGEGRLENTLQRACRAAGTGSLVGVEVTGTQSGDVTTKEPVRPGEWEHWTDVVTETLATADPADALGTASIKRPGGQYMPSRAHALRAPRLHPRGWPGRRCTPALPTCGQRPGRPVPLFTLLRSTCPPLVEGSPEESGLRAQVSQKDRKSLSASPRGGPRRPARLRESPRQSPPVWEALNAISEGIH